MTKIKDSYNQICEDWYEFRNKSKINKCIVEFTNYLKENSSVLDIGCGTAYPIDSYLISKKYKVTGIDISEKMIDKALSLKLPNSRFLVCDLLNFKTNEKYDAIIAFDSLWHIKHENQETIYTILSNLLKPNGYLLFTHGKENGEIKGTMFNREFYYSALSTKKVHNLLKRNRFKIIKSIENYEEETTGTRDLLIIAKKQ